ncbi:MAG TPA: hypothetical protein VGI46_11080, partial [Candidatus Acidoferrum sp.]
MKSPIHHRFARLASWRTAIPALLLFLLIPPSGKAQDVGQIECARAGDFVFLYSSILTLDIRSTLQCGQQVEITGRYDNYFGVRTAKGETGFVTLDSISLLKTTPGAKPVLAPTKEPAREKLHYDQPDEPSASPANAPGSNQFVVLL